MNQPWDKWTLTQWLTELENRYVEEIQLGLNRIAKVADKLSLTKTKSKVITVAGTNGKGSTVTALATLYDKAGYKVGSYTSPHLLTFNERIRINLRPINDDELCKALSYIEGSREDTALTFFEMVTLAALHYFQQQELDVIVLEVGLGGRLDATNIIDADLAIITTIDFDHQDRLGNTLDAIGYEKAGILREGKPMIFADTNPPSSINDRIKQLHNQSYFWGRDYSFDVQRPHWSFHGFETIDQLPIPSIHLKSAAAALMAINIFQKQLPIGHQDIKAALTFMSIDGRLQLQEVKGIKVLYDVSHNPQAARLLAQEVNALKPINTVHAVFSALKDKDIVNVLTPLKSYVHRWYPAQLVNKRAPSPKELLSAFNDAEILVNICYNSPFVAFQEALNLAVPGDLILVFGSFYTVADVISAQNKLLK